jgi:ribosomal protein S21
MSKALVRVEARRLPPYATQEDRDREGRSLINRFKRVCHENNILHQIKVHEYFIRPCDKRRQKKAQRLLAIRRMNEQPKEQQL